MKLSVRQREVIEKMREGWFLMPSSRLLVHVDADTAIKVHKSTIAALREKGLLDMLNSPINVVYYRLTQKGKEA